MLLSAFVLAFSLHGASLQSPTGDLTITSTGAPARVLLPQLGNLVGQKFVAGVDIADDVFALRLTKASVSDVMDRIAKVEFAEWKHDKEKWVLTRTQVLEQKREAAELALKTAAMKEGLEKASKLFAATPPLNEQRARTYVADLDALYKRAKENLSFDVAGVQSRSPSRRAVIGIVSKLDPEKLASMHGERLVYSTRPTGMQQPMPEGSLQVLKDFQDEYSLFAKVAKEVRQGQTPNLRIGGVDEPPSEFKPGASIDKAVLVLRSSGLPDGVQCSLQLYAAEGQQIAAGTLYGLDASTQNSKAIEIPKDDPEIKLPPLASEIAKLANEQPFGQGSSMQTSVTKNGKSALVRFTGGKRRPPTPYSEAVKAAVMSPEKLEPLSLAPGEALVRTAEVRSANLIALMPDISFSVYNTLFGKQPSIPATRVLSEPAVRDQMIIESANGWITVAPKYPIAAEQYRVPRVALGRLDTAVIKNGFCSLTDLLQFASEQNKPLFNFGAQIDSLYTRIASGGFGVRSGNTDWDAIRFVSALSAEQSRSLRNGSKLQIRDFTEGQSRLLSKLVYSAQDGPQVKYKTSVYGDEVNTYGYGGHLSYERTEALASGLPADGYLTVAANITPGVFATNTKNGGGEMLDVRALATYRLQGEMPSVIQSVGMPPNFDSYLPAERAEYDFTLTYSPSVSQTIHLEDFRAAKDGVAGPYSSLPSDFRNKVEEDYKFLVEMFKN